MSQEVINVGAAIGDVSADPNRTCWQKTNSNFTELYAAGFFSASSNYVGNSTINSIDPTSLAEGTSGALIVGGGLLGVPNKIGSTVRPVSTYAGASDEWTDDTAFAALTGALRKNATELSYIGGGYDNYTNQIASVIVGGGHNYIKYDIGGHSLIVGGSYNLITRGRCVIAGGLNNWAGGNFAAVFAGSGNHATGRMSSVFCAENARAGAAGSTILNGDGSVIGASGVDSVASGSSHYLNGQRSAMFGEGGHWESANSVVVSAPAPTGGAQGAGHAAITAAAARTTNATLTNTNLSVVWRNGEDWLFTGHVFLQGMDAATNDIVCYLQPVVIKMVAGICTMYKLTGSYTTPNSSNTAPGSAAEIMPLDSFVDEIGVGECHLRSTSGTAAGILLRVTGKADTTIDWSASLVGTWLRTANA